jgi:hypothetical protein
MINESDRHKVNAALAEAGVIAATVVEQHRQAAFLVLLEWLLSRITADGSMTEGAGRRGPQPRGKVARRAEKHALPQNGTSATSDDELLRLMDTIDRTAHPIVRPGAKALDIGLGILGAVKLIGVDWLNPRQIVLIAREKFRLSVDQAAIRMALGKATQLVDRKRDGSGFSYRLAGPGEAYLEAQNASVAQ